MGERKKPKFIVVREYGDEGLHTFYVEGHEVGRCDHDSHGWEGMASMRDMFSGIASALGANVEIQEQ